MSLAKITLFGMYRWMQQSEDDLFSELDVPDGIDASGLVQTILSKGAEFEVLYGDPEFMKSMIGVWSNRWYPTFDRWYKALTIEYNPLENYDRMEEWSDAGSKNKTGKATTESNSASTNTISNNETQTDNGQSSTADSSYTKAEHDSTNEHQVSAYDSSTYQPENKDILSGDDTVTNSSSATQNTTKNDRTIDGNTTAINSSAVHSSNDNTENEQQASAHRGRIHGNIGTLTSQTMLQSELDIARFNLYDEMADLFLQEFCVYTY